MEAKQRGFIYRIIAILLSVSLVPFIIGSAYSMNVFVKQATDLANTRNDNELKRTGSLLDSALRQMRDLVVSSITEERFLQAGTITERLALVERLSRMATVNKYIDEVVWYSVNDPFALVSNHGIERDLDSPAYSWIDPAVEGMFNYQIKQLETRELPLEIGPRAVFSWIAKLPQVDGRQYYTIFHFNMERLFNDYIRMMNAGRDGGSMYLIEPDGHSYYPPDAIPAGDTVRSEYRLETSGWTLVSEINVGSLYREVDSMKRQFIVLVAIAATGMMLPIAGMGIRFLYHPMRSVLRRNDRLEGQLREKERRLKRTLLRNLIIDRFVGEADVRMLQEYEGLLAVVMFTLKQTGSEWSGEGACRMQQVWERLETLGLVEVFPDSDRRWIGLFRLKQTDLNAFIVELMALLDDREHELLDMSIGGVYRLDQISRSYTEALYAYNMGRLYTTSTNVFCYSKLPSDYHPQIGLHTAEELELAMRQRNGKAYIDLLNDMFREDLSVMEYNYNLHLHITVLIRLFEQDSLSFLNEMNDLIVERGTMNAVVLKQFFYSKYEVFSGDYQKESKQYLPKIEQFIDESYHTNFSLDDLAEYAGISKQYASALFKQHHGMTVVDYANRHRIDKSKQLLAERHVKIAEIGGKVGFNSNSYFNKVFKQYTGVTPSEYRELLLNRNG